MAVTRRTTLREATRKNRPMFEAYRRISEIRATTLRYHLGARFRDLAPWVDGDPWGGFFDENGLLVTPPIPDHERFWSVIRSAEEREEVNGGDPRKYVEDVFRPGRVAPDGFAFPYEWREPARRIFFVRHILRSDAWRHLKKESRKQQEVWQRGHEVCPANNDQPCREQQHACGLTNFVQADGIREDWVTHAVAWLRCLQIEGTSEESAWAKSILEKVANMLWQVGSGDISERTKGERAAAKTRQNRINGALRKLRRRFDAELAVYRGDPVLAYREAVGGVMDDTSIADDALDDGGDGGEYELGPLAKLDAVERDEVLWLFAKWASKRDSRGK